MGRQAEKMMVCLLNISLLWSVCEAQSGKISQPASFQTAELGQPVTITCHLKRSFRTRVWCKLNTGRRLQVLASIDTSYNLTTYKEHSHHYLVKSDRMSTNLTISTTTWEDVGTYYCGLMELDDIEFGQGTFLMIKGANMISDSVVQQPESQSVQPGDSVTLSCSLHTGHCGAEHTRVMWLKSSHHAAPQTIYSSGNKSHICGRTESGETECVYNRLMSNLSSDDAGTYYCVVTSCGQTLFGNGTRINIHTRSLQLSPAVIGLILSNIVLGVVTILFVWTLCRNNKKDPPAASTLNDGSLEGNQTGDGVIYATVYSAKRGSSCRPASVKYSQDTVFYSDVGFCQQDR